MVKLLSPINRHSSATKAVELLCLSHYLYFAIYV